MDSKVFRVNGPTQTASLVATPDQQIAKSLALGRYYEHNLLNAIRKYDLKGVYVDVGANIGNHSVYFALECPSTQIIAIEPWPKNFQEMEESIQLNSLQAKFTALNIAIHPTDKAVGLLDRNPPSSAYPNAGRVIVTEGQEYPAETLSEVLKGIAPIVVIKLDVEGMETDCLKSGLTEIREQKPLIACEATTNEAVAAVSKILEPFGYRWNPENLGFSPTFLWVPDTILQE